MSLQFALDAFQFLLVLLLDGPEGVNKFFDDFQRFFNGIAVLLAVGQLGAFELALPAFPIEVLLELDDLVGELLYFLLVDVGEVVNVGVVELLDGFS